MNECEQNFHQQVVSSQMKLQEENQRLAMKENYLISMYQKKLLLKEEERERRKSQIDLVEMSVDGILSVRTQNLQMDARRRMVCNFKNPEIFVFKRLENSDEMQYLFSFECAGEIKKVWLQKEKVGNAKYLLKQLASVGGQILGENPSRCKEYAVQIVAMAVTNSKITEYVPDKKGWYIDEKNNLKFYSKKYVWEEIKNYGK